MTTFLDAGLENSYSELCGVGAKTGPSKERFRGPTSVKGRKRRLGVCARLQ